MLDVVVDGNVVQVPVEGEDTVGDIVGRIASNLDKRRRVVGVRVNGEDITGVAEHHLAKAENLQRMEVTTGLAGDLAVQTLESIEEFRKALVLELNSASEQYRLGNVTGSNDLFVRCLDGLQILLRTTHSVATLLEKKGDEISTGEMTLDSATDRLSQLLDELIDAQRNQDSILIADLIEYELQPLLEDWKRGIDSLKEIGAAA
ncbi:MAG TPA: hypothetical protein ENI92_09250 [Bacteroidetes bacterium]|nr:hypothetical protein [Bacteroidota bacterium]